MLQMYNYRLRYPLKNELLYAKDPSRKPEVEQESFEGAFETGASHPDGQVIDQL